MNIAQTERENQTAEDDLTPEERVMMEVAEQQNREHQRECFRWDIVLEKDLLGHMLRSPELLERCADYMRPEWFTLEVHAKIAKKIVTLWSAHHELPRKDILEALLRDDTKDKNPEYQVRLLVALREAYEYYGDETSLGAVESRLLEFARRAERHRVAFDLVQKGDEDAAVTRLEAIKTIGNRDIVDMDGIEFLDYADSLTEEWLVDNWLPRRVLVLFSGVQKLGKSTVGFSLASCGIRGLDWFGNHVAADFPVVFLDYENPAQFVAGNLKAYMTRDELLPWRHNLRIVERDNLPKGLTAEWVRQYLTEKNLLSRPGLIVVDSAIRAFGALCPGIPNWDNSASEVNRVLKPFQDLARKTGWTIHVIHHENKTGSTTGSQQWEAVPDYVWRFTTHQDDYRRLHIKGRLLHRPADLIFRWDNDRSRIEPKDSPKAEKASADRLLAAVPEYEDEEEARRSPCPTLEQLMVDTGLTRQQAKDRLTELAEQLQVFSFQENNNRSKPKRYWRKSSGLPSLSQGARPNERPNEQVQLA